MSSEVGYVAGNREIPPPAPGSTDTFNFSDVIAKMRDGVPVIQKSETCVPGSSEMSMCLILLTDDLASLKLIRQSESEEDQIAVSTLHLSEVEQVAVANSEKHAIGLLVPGRELIIEVIFATEEDWNVWYSGLKVLCASSAQTKNEEHHDARSVSGDSCVTEMQDHSCIATASPTAELVALVNELQSQNEGLKDALKRYDGVMEDMRTQLAEERESRDRAESQNLRMKKLLMVREDTITELSELVQSLLKKQAGLSQIHDEGPDEYFIGSERKVRSRDPSPRITNLMRISARSTPATSVSDSMEAPQVLQNLESQLRMLEQRKNFLEKMLEQTIAGQ
jgi:hypothetical protein